MQQRRTGSSPGSLPLTNSDVQNNGSNTKKSHRSRLQRRSKKKNSMNIFTLQLLSVILGSLAVVYLLAGRKDGHRNKSLKKKFKYPSDLNIGGKAADEWSFQHGAGKVESFHDPREQNQRTILEKKSKEEEEEDLENRDGMMNFRPDTGDKAAVAVDVNVDVSRGEKEEEVVATKSSMKKEFEEGKISEISFFNPIFENANMIALYFAALWCPVSTPATDSIQKSFYYNPDAKDLLFTNNLLDADSKLEEKKELAIVYISSDHSEEEMENFLQEKMEWIIPLKPHDSPEIAKVKKIFHTCSHGEEGILEMDRKFGIPRLVILDSDTKDVLTTDGINDVLNQGFRALERWKELQKAKHAAMLS